MLFDLLRAEPLDFDAIDFAGERQYFDVPDPMGGSHDEYMNVMHLIQDAEKKIFEKIQSIDQSRREP